MNPKQNLPSYGSSLSSENTSRPTEESKLNFYEYKWILNILMEISDFREKNDLNKRNPEPGEKFPYFVYHCDPGFMANLIAKMKQRLREFEPEIIRTTTAHIGYYEV